MARERTAKDETEVDSSANSGDEDDAVWKDENVENKTRLLETYVSVSHIWR